ncbi:MAG: NAD(P)H-dependent glycerol-3-phosphate dehydrogenase [Planctomycetota bacterium]|jgi:glycerol-3-phosphate dehydrogenase (NAD(P)+)
MRIAVLGNGGFGTAMAMTALRAGNEVRIWGHDAGYTDEIAATRENPRYLPGLKIPEEILISADAGEVCAGVDALLMAVPTQHIRGVLESISDSLPTGRALVSLAKGLEEGTGERPSQVISECLGEDHPVLVLCGPSHAEEIARGMPATLVLAGGEDELRAELQSALSASSFRIYSNPDMLGVELCGALKNVMSLAAGIAEGLGLGDNAKAATMSRGLIEMSRYGMAEGAQLQTFFGLAGVGDLAVTTFSPHGRNRAFGERIGRGETLDEILKSTPKVAEGVWTSRVVRKRARELDVDMPICEGVCAVLFEGMAPADAVRNLMEREYKEEISF